VLLAETDDSESVFSPYGVAYLAFREPNPFCNLLNRQALAQQRSESPDVLVCVGDGTILVSELPNSQAGILLYGVEDDFPCQPKVVCNIVN
jgi:hypothetical protein